MLGCADGRDEGCTEGCLEGIEEGCALGWALGCEVGCLDGLLVGCVEGCDVGVNIWPYTTYVVPAPVRPGDAPYAPMTTSSTPSPFTSPNAHSE